MNVKLSRRKNGTNEENKKNTNLCTSDNMREVYTNLNRLIKNNKIKFEFYNSIMPVDILKFYYNETDNTIKFSIRDTFQSHADELKELIEKSTKVNA